MSILILLCQAHQSYFPASRPNRSVNLLSTSLPPNSSTHSVANSDSKSPLHSNLTSIQLRSNLQPPKHENDQTYKYTISYLGFGYGKNTDLDHGKHRHNITPSPDNYQIDSFVDTDSRHKRGMSTHIGREVSNR